MKSSELPWHITYTSPDATVAPSSNVFHHSWVPASSGPFETLGYAYPDKSIVLPVGLYISRYLLLLEPSAYSEKNKPVSVLYWFT